MKSLEKEAMTNKNKHWSSPTKKGRKAKRSNARQMLKQRLQREAW